MEKGTVWIIGGSSGLGLATVKAFAADGWFVISGARSFTGDNQEGAIRELPLDVTDEQSCAAFMREAFLLRTRVDVLVYCAAILMLSPCEFTERDEYTRVMQTNFLGITSFVARALPKMREQKTREDRVVLLHQRLARNPVSERLCGIQTCRGGVCGMPRDGM